MCFEIGCKMPLEQHVSLSHDGAAATHRFAITRLGRKAIHRGNLLGGIQVNWLARL